VVRRGGAPRRRQHYGGRRRPALVPIVPRSQAEGEAQWNLTEMTGGQRSPIGVVNNGDGFDSIERGGASAVGVDNTSPWSRSGGYGGVHSREATQMKIRVREELGGVGRGESPEWISPGGGGAGGGVGDASCRTQERRRGPAVVAAAACGTPIVACVGEREGGGWLKPEDCQVGLINLKFKLI
jgi:hypothetical protein